MEISANRQASLTRVRRPVYQPKCDHNYRLIMKHETLSTLYPEVTKKIIKLRVISGNHNDIKE